MTIHSPIPVVSTFLAGRRQLLIDGEWCDAVSGKTFDVFDPATGQKIAAVSEGDAADIDLAVKAARRSFEAKTWRGLLPQQRRAILWRFAELIDEHSAELAQIDVINNGMPIWMANAMMGAASDALRYFAGQTTAQHGLNLSDAVSGNDEFYHTYTSREPIGVVGLITPWNGPAPAFVFKVGTALAAGCSCVVKPAEATPLSALRLGELALEAGVPPGVLNIVPGFGPTAGQALADHPLVEKISFTGSTAVGKRIVASSASNLKRVTLELGGKSPCVILDDADLSIAIQTAAMGIFMNSGQMCIAGSRLYAHRKIFDQVVSGIAAIGQAMKIGNGLDPQTQIGPLISAKQREQVFRYIEGARASGADIVTGGALPSGQGHFIEPTIFANVNSHMNIVREEVFGPVMVVSPFDDLDDVVRQANDTRYGLAAGVFTTNLSQAHRLAARLEAGNVWVNCYGLLHPSIPFGGVKESGWGREFGSEGIDAYMATKSVRIRI
jgi:acyl-CoA reductase-like NAD-dependent aldehyde dehydrogenase